MSGYDKFIRESSRVYKINNEIREGLNNIIHKKNSKLSNNNLRKFTFKI